MYEMQQAVQSRMNVAERLRLDTMAHETITLSPNHLPWLDGPADVNVVAVDSPHGVFIFGNATGKCARLKEIAHSEMQGRHTDDDRLNAAMYGAIQCIMSGNPGAVKRMRNAPAGMAIYYDGLTSGARVYFADMGKHDGGQRLFMKLAVCGSKNSEPNVYKIFSGRKNERVKK